MLAALDKVGLSARPQWTTTGSWTMGRDPLGLQATSIRIYQSLVPGVTNITNRLRYYSFYPWLVRLFEKTHHSAKPDIWATFVRRGEALYALATVVADQEASDGLGGSLWASKHREAATNSGINLRPYADDPRSSETYLQARRGNFGGAYARTMMDLGWLTESIVPVTVGRGTELAGSFETSIGEAAELISQAVAKGTVSGEALRAIGEAVHPASIPEESAELGLLREFLLGAWKDKGAAARQSSIWILLDLYRRGIAIGDINATRTAFYEAALPNGERLPSDSMVFRKWRAYQANEYAHIALECALNGLVGLQREEFPDGVEPRRLVQILVEQALPSSDLDWAHWASATIGRRTESLLATNILAGIGVAERPSNQLVLEAFELLALLWSRWAKGDGDVRPTLVSTAGRSGRSLAGILQTLDESQNEPARDALTSLLHRHIINDHQLIAGHKLSAAGTFTYHFMIEDGLLTEGELGIYTYTNPRLSNLTRLLRDARFIDSHGVTQVGEAFLEQNQPL